MAGQHHEHGKPLYRTNSHSNNVNAMHKWGRVTAVIIILIPIIEVKTLLIDEFMISFQ